MRQCCGAQRQEQQRRVRLEGTRAAALSDACTLWARGRDSGLVETIRVSEGAAALSTQANTQQSGSTIYSCVTQLHTHPAFAIRAIIR